MPMIRPSSDLRNKYAEVSEYCHKHEEPIFLTKNGIGDLAVMSIENYERLVALSELRVALSHGLQDVEDNQTKPVKDVFEKLHRKMG